MDDGNPLLRVIIFIAFIVLDAIFYGFGAAIQNVNTSELEHQMEEGSEKARKLLHIVNRPTRFVNTIQITTNLIGMVTGAFVLEQFGAELEAILARGSTYPRQWMSFTSLLLVSVVLVVLLISFGIIIPKRCAAENPEKWGYRMLPAVTLIMIPLVPFTWLANKVAHFVLKLLGIGMASDYENVTEEDIMSMVNEGHEQGVLEAREAEMITNIFELNDKEAGDIMTHRKNLVALDGEITLREAVNFILKEGFNSRYPVYKKDVDDIIGILHMKDALIAVENKRNAGRQLWEIDGLLREAHFIPETRNIDTLFKEMQSGKIHMVIVVDEYGQTAGIVTMEDILEEIVGNILDEYDVDEEYIVQSDDGSYMMNGMTPLEEVEKALNIEFEEEDYDSYDTINGLLISKLDRIPQEDEQTEVSILGYNFKILQVENKMIHTVRVQKAEPEEVQEEDTVIKKSSAEEESSEEET
ncbi:hemolysin family protein [Clostridium sp. Marseille-P2415]|uniref:hemolysin family protein n=1 Tax=Clostridium sp. Marseille-P2415 TaxID=1805471 RepID=UPI0009887703|nr:hemolysin family protein [Clostridium sp. Marseille-P2415]